MREYIYALGIGMYGTHQLTSEVKTALERSDVIFLVHPHKLIIDELKNNYQKIVSLSNEYKENQSRRDIYRKISNRVIKEHENTEKQVALAVYGHPLFGVTPTTHLKEQTSEDVEIIVRAGISSFDSLIIDLDIDPFHSGIQLFEVNDLLANDRALDSQVPVLLFQIGTVESELYTTDSNHPERFSNIKRHLERFYPDDHKIVLCKTSTLPFEKSKAYSFKLSEFEEIHKYVDDSHTIYIPPIDQKTDKNEGFLNRLNSKSHLDTITENE